MRGDSDGRGEGEEGTHTRDEEKWFVESRGSDDLDDSDEILMIIISR